MAANALGGIGDPGGVPHLIESLSDPVFTVRKAAASALAAIGRDAQDVLLRALNEQRGSARRRGGERTRRVGSSSHSPLDCRKR